MLPTIGLGDGPGGNGPWALLRVSRTLVAYSKSAPIIKLKSDIEKGMTITMGLEL